MIQITKLGRLGLLSKENMDEVSLIQPFISSKRLNASEIAIFNLPAAPVVQQSKEMREVSIPPEVYKGEGHQLFDFLATTLRDFILEHKSKCVLPCKMERQCVYLRPGQCPCVRPMCFISLY